GAVVVSGVFVGLQALDQWQDGFSIPTLRAQLFPQIHVFGRWVECDTGVMRRTATQNACTGVTHKRVSVFLWFDGVAPIQTGFQQLWPPVQLQDYILINIGWAGFYQGNRNVGIFTQPGGYDSSGGATTDHQVIIIVFCHVMLQSYCRHFLVVSPGVIWLV